MSEQDTAERYHIDPAHLSAGPKWWTNEEYHLPDWRLLRQTSVSRRKVQSAFRWISRRLFCTETVVLELQRLWMHGHLPLECMTKLDESGANTDRFTYQSSSFLDVSLPAFKKKGPAALDAFFLKLERRANEVREALKDYWVDEAASRVSEFLERVHAAGGLTFLDDEEDHDSQQPTAERMSFRTKEVDEADDEYEKW